MTDTATRTLWTLAAIMLGCAVVAVAASQLGTWVLTVASSVAASAVVVALIVVTHPRVGGGS